MTTPDTVKAAETFWIEGVDGNYSMHYDSGHRPATVAEVYFWDKANQAAASAVELGERVKELEKELEYNRQFFSLGEKEARLKELEGVIEGAEKALRGALYAINGREHMGFIDEALEKLAAVRKS